jgi:hypothetical protein
LVHEREPRGLDWLATEMAEIGIERFASGDGEKDESKRHEADMAMG